jgi:hypothetical protein
MLSVGLRTLQVLEVLPERRRIKLGEEPGGGIGVKVPDFFDQLTFCHGRHTFD